MTVGRALSGRPSVASGQANNSVLRDPGSAELWTLWALCFAGPRVLAPDAPLEYYVQTGSLAGLATAPSSREPRTQSGQFAANQAAGALPVQAGAGDIPQPAGKRCKEPCACLEA